MEPIRLHAFNPGPMTGAGNTTYLIPGRRTVLIDAGVGDARHLDLIAQALADRGVDLDAVLVTHAHGDHASGAGAIAQRWPHVSFFKYPAPERDAKYPVSWQPLVPGEAIAAGDGTLTPIHTPGHAPDHLVFWDEGSRTLYGGDLAVAGTTVVILWSQGGSLAAYLESLHRVLALDPVRILPAHGPEIGNPRLLLTTYLRHRQAREQQVLEALDRGHSTVDEVVEAIYPELQASPLRRMAAESVRAHLAKLEDERRVRHEDEHFVLVTGSEEQV